MGRESSHREGLRKTSSLVFLEHKEREVVCGVCTSEETALVRSKREGRTGSLLSDCTEKEFPHRYVLRDKVYAKVNTLASNF